MTKHGTLIEAHKLHQITWADSVIDHSLQLLIVFCCLNGLIELLDIGVPDLGAIALATSANVFAEMTMNLSIVICFVAISLSSLDSDHLFAASSSLCAPFESIP